MIRPSILKEKGLYLLLQVLKEDSVFVVASKRSVLDKCNLPLGIRVFVSAGHTKNDIFKAAESLKRVAETVLYDHCLNY